MFAQRFLVALETGKHVVYAPASGWDRVYLLWTFRNFRSLPQKVLSPRQQQLMASLYHDASNYQAYQLHDAVVVGRVEDFNPSSLSALPVSTTFRRRFHAWFAFNRMTLRVGAGALVALIAILAWHELGAQSVSNLGLAAALVPTPLSKHHPAITQDLTVKDVTVRDLNPATVQPPSDNVPAQPSPTAVAGTEAATAAPAGAVLAPVAAPDQSASPIPRASRVTSKREPIAPALNGRGLEVSPSLHQAAADQARMQISGRPKKLVYPVCPQTTARGKVSLQAVVGSDGTVNGVTVLTGDRILAAAAVEAVRQWRYEPFAGAAERLERETNITVSFISSQVVAVSFPSSAPLSR